MDIDYFLAKKRKTTTNHATAAYILTDYEHPMRVFFFNYPKYFG